MKVLLCEDADWLLSEEAFSIYASCMFQPTYEDYKAQMEGQDERRTAALGPFAPCLLKSNQGAVKPPPVIDFYQIPKCAYRLNSAKRQIVINHAFL